LHLRFLEIVRQAGEGVKLQEFAPGAAERLAESVNISERVLLWKGK